MATRITERYSYKTDIITAYDGHEQRIKTRQYPRRTLSYDYDAMTPSEAHWLRAQMRLRQSDTMYIPMWHRATRMTHDFFMGKLWWVDPTALYGFLGAEGLEVFSYDDVTGAKNVNVQRVIESYSAEGTIITKTPLQRICNRKNTWLYPLVKCTTQPTDGLNYVFSDGTSVTMNFEDIAYDSVAQLPYSIVHDYFYDLVPQFNRFHLPEKYQEREVLLNNPQWDTDDTLKLGISKLTYKADSESGIFRYDLRNSKSYDTHTCTFLFRNRPMIDNFLKFFKNHGGMYKSFWMPSWVNDFQPVRDIKAGDTSFVVDLVSLDWYYLSNARKKKIVIFTNDWKCSIHDISTYSKFTEGTRRYGRIYLSTPVDRDIPLSNFRQISYFNLVRFDSDELQVDYESDEVATVTISFKEVDDIDAIQ